MPPKSKRKAPPKGDTAVPSTTSTKRGKNQKQQKGRTKPVPDNLFEEKTSINEDDGGDEFDDELEQDTSRLPRIAGEQGIDFEPDRPALDRGDEVAYAAEVNSLLRSTGAEAAAELARNAAAASAVPVPAPAVDVAPAPAPGCLKRVPPPPAIPPGSPKRTSARIAAKKAVVPSSSTPKDAPGIPLDQPESAEAHEKQMESLKEANKQSYNQQKVEQSRSKARDTDAEQIARMRILCLMPRMKAGTGKSIPSKITVFSANDEQSKRFHNLMQSGGRVMKYCFLSTHSVSADWPAINKLHRFDFEPYYNTDKAIAEGEKRVKTKFDDSVNHVVTITHPDVGDSDQQTRYGLATADAVICSELKHALEEKYVDKDPCVTLRFASLEVLSHLVNNPGYWTTATRFIQQNFDFLWLGTMFDPTQLFFEQMERLEQGLQFITLLSAHGVRTYPPVSHLMFASDSWKWGPALHKYLLPSAYLELPFHYTADSKIAKKYNDFPKDRYSLREVVASTYWKDLTWEKVHDMNIVYLKKNWKSRRDKSQGTNGCFDADYLHLHGVFMEPHLPSHRTLKLVFIPPNPKKPDSKLIVYDGLGDFMHGGEQSTCMSPSDFFDSNYGFEEDGKAAIPNVTGRYRVSIGTTVFKHPVPKPSSKEKDAKEKDAKEKDAVDPEKMVDSTASYSSSDDDVVDLNPSEVIPAGATNSRPTKVVMCLGQTGSIGALMRISYKGSEKSLRESHTIKNYSKSNSSKKPKAKKGKKDDVPDGDKKPSAKKIPNALKGFPFEKMKFDMVQNSHYRLKLVPGVLYETEWITSNKVMTYPWYEKSNTHYILTKFSLFPAGSDFVLQEVFTIENKTLFILRWERVGAVVEQVAYMIGKFYTDWPR